MLREKRGFKYIISVKITLKKRINDNEFNFKTLHVNWLVKIVINQGYRFILIVFYDMIADIMSNKKFQAIIKELFIRCRKLNISLVFIT